MLSCIKRLYMGAFMMCCLPLLAQAETTTPAQPLWPDQVIEQVTTQLLASVETHRATFKDQPEAFYAEVEAAVLPVMDMRNFARGVMGRYASSKAYRALKTDQEKEQFKNRVLTFTEVFKKSVVRTYSKGMITFNGQNIAVTPMTEAQKQEAEKSGRAVIEQKIITEGEEPYVLNYSFARNRDGQWLARNILVDGINLGRVYQSQFAQAVIDNNDDIDAAIANWSVALNEK